LRISPALLTNAQNPRLPWGLSKTNREAPARFGAQRGVKIAAMHFQ
jgi:hypothetical protein